MQIIKGHSVIRFFNVSDCWVVDGCFTYYYIRSLANALCMSIEEIKEILE